MLISLSDSNRKQGARTAVRSPGGATSIDIGQHHAPKSTFREATMIHLQLTDVQSTNLHLLHAIRLGIEHERVSTCCKFALDAALADHLRTLDLGQLMSFVANVGPTSLFPPRHDLLTLLAGPAPLAAPFAAVRSPRGPAVHTRV